MTRRGKTIFAKSPSTPADQSVGVMAGLEELARRLDLTRADMLAGRTGSCTARRSRPMRLLERKGAKVALLTTEGHRDVIEMREGLKDDRYDLRSPPPEPLVPRELRFGVKERLQGRMARSRHRLTIARSITPSPPSARSGASSVAVCFLHSYLQSRA